MTRIRLAALPLVLALLGAPSLDAQEAAGPVSDGEMREALRGHAGEVARDRAVVDRVLSDERVGRAAAEHGIDIERVRDAAASLEGEDLSRVAEEAREVEERVALAQESFTISTIHIIIGLLVLILLILIL